MKDRLETEGMRVVPGAWQIAGDSAVDDPGWQIQSVFEASALIGALGEASVDPLTIRWDAPCEDSIARRPLLGFLERLLEHAERSRVRLALSAGLDSRQLSDVLRDLHSPYLGACCDIGRRSTDVTAEIRLLGEKLFALDAPPGVGSLSSPSGSPGTRLDWSVLVQTVRGSGFSGPVFLPEKATPVEYACAVGFFHGLVAAGGLRPVFSAG
jgi:hypothetical protein